MSIVVVRALGVHSPFSADYMHSWGNTPKDLLAEVEVVRRTAASIIERV